MNMPRIPAQRPGEGDRRGTAEITTASLLGRPEQVVFGPAAAALFEGRRVLVTGAGGSIGSEIVRQLRRLRPERIYLLDHDESALHTLCLELNGHGHFDDDDVLLASVRDARAMHELVATVRPHVVVHAAAHKHLPLLERYPAEAVWTNVAGTENVVRAAAAHGVGLFVNISTDKAAAPTSVLGTSKRLAEAVVASVGRAAHSMDTASVRFGNVLGSRGSFLPGLVHQIDHGQPVTITHPDVTRFFMTIPEAAGLVLEAAVMARAGETYVLDMGTPVSILELAQRYARRRGIEHLNVEFTGLRPGEKLHEELLDARERCTGTPHPRVWCVQPDADSLGMDLTDRLLELYDAARHADSDVVRKTLRAAIDAPEPRGLVEGAL